ncbi:methyltransferase [Bacteroidia bacterium]|nr:methyltransferase [Bacteroidia bacterium]
MMTGKERIDAVLSHQEADKIALDFGATPTTGIHVKQIAALRQHYGLENKPVKVIEPFQMLGEVDDELAKLWNVDAIGVSGTCDMMGHRQENFVEKRMPCGQVVLLPECFNMKQENGNTYIFPQGDTNVPPSATMPESGYFFDAIERVPATDFDTELKLEDNLEEFTLISDNDLTYWKGALNRARATGRSVVANIGGTGLGDIALVPAMSLKNPKGIRAIADWYMSTMAREDFLHEIFERQTDIAIQNLDKINREAGKCIDVIYICGTDFGTQDSQFCSADALDSLYGDAYRKVNNWIHQNTGWKTFKHCCGAIVPLLDKLIDFGFDIVNPVQINAAGMDPQFLKANFGSKVTFWGGGIDTQKVLPLATPQQVKEQVYQLCDIFGTHGGFVFTSIHNIQANVPLENVVALMDAISEVRK